MRHVSDFIQFLWCFLFFYCWINFFVNQLKQILRNSFIGFFFKSENNKEKFEIFNYFYVKKFYSIKFRFRNKKNIEKKYKYSILMRYLIRNLKLYESNVYFENGFFDKRKITFCSIAITLMNLSIISLV